MLVAVSFTWGQRSEAHVRRIILSTQHLGAHGMGYNTRSLWQLSKRLTPDDIPVLLSLGGRNSGIAVGAQFGLASQCGSAIVPVRDAATQHKLMSLDAEDTLLLISEFEGCSPDVRSAASAAEAELHRFFEEEHQRIEREAKQKEEDDSRIQANGLKLLDPEKAKSLTRDEHLEIYHSSLVVMDLKEDGLMSHVQ